MIVRVQTHVMVETIINYPDRLPIVKLNGVKLKSSKLMVFPLGVFLTPDMTFFPFC